MATAKLRQIRRRIRSVQSTRKITRAMELIAASRIRKAQARVEAARPYVQRLVEVVRDLAAQSGVAQHPLLSEREDSSGVHGLVVVTSDRGLCGAYNANVMRLLEGAIERLGGIENVSIYGVGRKGLTYTKYRGYPVAYEMVGVTDKPSYQQAKSLAEVLESAYLSGKLSRVTVVYTEFYNLVVQRAEEFQLLPIPKSELAGGEGFKGEFLFEPSPQEILSALLPRYVESRLFAAFLEASASEHASRRKAMKAATDNADELLRVLGRIHARERQAEITTEIVEVVSGAEALKEKQLEAAGRR
ncbi:MAG: F0F1 ATP synthase subunit gamma [Acidimicrobiia bacterium]